MQEPPISFMAVAAATGRASPYLIQREYNVISSVVPLLRLGVIAGVTLHVWHSRVTDGVLDMKLALERRHLPATLVAEFAIGLLLLGAGAPQSWAADDEVAAPPRSGDRPLAVRIARAPLWPLYKVLDLVGDGIEGTLAFFKNSPTVLTVKDFLLSLEVHGIVPEYGGLGDGSGSGGGLRFTRLDTVRWQTYVEGRASVRAYQRHEAALAFGGGEDRPPLWQLIGVYSRKPREDFFGVGPVSRKASRTDFTLEETRVEFAVRPIRTATVEVAATVRYQNENLSDGHDPRLSVPVCRTPGDPRPRWVAP